MSAESLARDLKRLKEKLDDHKNSRARLEGALDSAMADLKKLGCKTIADANKKAQALRAQSDELQEKISNGMAKLREEYGW